MVYTFYTQWNTDVYVTIVMSLSLDHINLFVQRKDFLKEKIEIFKPFDFQLLGNDFLSLCNNLCFQMIIKWEAMSNATLSSPCLTLCNLNLV